LAAVGGAVFNMRIQITLDGIVIAWATLEPHACARDFAALLPLELPLADYDATEKIADLPRKLSLQGVPDAYTPSAGDISYYAPWGNLAIFYRDGAFSRGLVRLGRIDAGAHAIQHLQAVTIRIERADASATSPTSPSC
jgi:hypothetical protein